MTEAALQPARTDVPSLPHPRFRAREVLSVLLYFLGVVLVFFREPLLFPSHFHIPYDLDSYHYPLSDFIAWSLRNFHSLPWWNPYSYMGQPFFGNVQAATFYPPTLATVAVGNLLFGRLPFYLLELQLGFHVVAAGVGTYLLIRLMRATGVAALAGATIYALGPFFASQTQHLGVISCAAWLPWFIAGLCRLEQRRDWTSAALAGLALALMILPGFPAGYLPAFVFGPLLYGSWMWQRHPQFEWRFHIRPTLLFATAVILAIMLSAISWMPAYQMAKHSVAEHRPIFQALDGIYPEALTSFFWPNLFGQMGRGTFHLKDNPTFLYLYEGIPALLLMLGGAWWLANSRKARPFLAAAVLALLWMFGRLAFVSELMYFVFPPSVRRGIYPHYVLAYFSLAFAILAALALDGYVQQERATLFLPRACWWAAAVAAATAVLYAGIGSFSSFASQTAISSATLLWVAAILACCGLLTRGQETYDHSGRKRLSAVFCVIIAADLITVGSSNILNTALGSRAGTPGAVSFLRQRLGPLPLYRVDTTGVSGSWQTQVAEWRLPSANGMDPLLLDDTVTYRAPFSTVAGRQFTLTSFQSPLLDLAGIRYIITPTKEVPGAVQVYQGEVNVFENSRALPRFFLVGSVVPARNTGTAVALIAKGSIDPAQVAVIAPRDASRFSGLAGPATTAELGTVKLDSYSPNRLTVQVETRRPAVLVATETFWKDWHATVDGTRVPITRADGIFRALRVPAGKHSVTMFIVPTMLYAGAGISLFGLLISLLVCARGLLKVRSAGHVEDFI